MRLVGSIAAICKKTNFPALVNFTIIRADGKNDFIAGCESTLKGMLIFIGIAGIFAGMIYLYGRQLGAISFFVLSIFFFSVARRLLVHQHVKLPRNKGNEQK